MAYPHKKIKWHLYIGRFILENKLQNGTTFLKANILYIADRHDISKHITPYPVCCRFFEIHVYFPTIKLNIYWSRWFTKIIFNFEMLFRIIEQENIHFIQNKYDKGNYIFLSIRFNFDKKVFRKQSALITIDNIHIL